MANLLDKASIIITPTAHDVGSINAIKPIQSISGELVTNGGFDTTIPLGTAGAGWRFVDSALDGSSAEYYNGGVRVIRTTNLSRFRPMVGTTTNTNFLPLNTNDYVITYEILSSGGQSTFTLFFGGNSIVAPTSVGTHTIYEKSGGTSAIIQFSPKSNSEIVLDNISIKEITNADLDFERATSGSVVGTAQRENSDGVLEQVAENVPRIDYLGGAGHWLIEPQATNTSTYSNDLSQGAIFSGSSAPQSPNATLTANQATSPDGTTNSMKLTCDTDTNQIHHIRIENVVVVSDNTNIISLFVKKGSGIDFFAIACDNYDTNNRRAWFNVNTGVLGTQSNVVDSNIEDYGDGWYRCSMAFKTTTLVSGTVRLIVTNADNTTQFDGNGEFHYFYGLQCETSDNDNATKPTSYIPTSGGTVTRAEDAFGLNTTLDTSLIDSTEGTFYAEIAALDNNLVDRNISLSDGAELNTIRFRYTTASNGLQLSVKVGTAQAAFTTTSFDITNFLKIGLRFKENDFSCFVNGSQLTNSVVGGGSTYPANTLTKIKSARGDNALDFAGKIKCISVFKEGLTDAELTCLTS